MQDTKICSKIFNKIISTQKKNNNIQKINPNETTE